MDFFEIRGVKEFNKFREEVLLNRKCGKKIIDLKRVSVQGLPNNLIQLGTIVNSYIRYLGYNELNYDNEWLEASKAFSKRFVTEDNEKSILNYNKRVNELQKIMNNCIRWKKVKYVVAKQIVAYILKLELAYNTQVMGKTLVSSFVSTFFDFFSKDALCFTNANFTSHEKTFRLNGWDPITDATFDTGIVLFDGSRIGILWVMDED